MSAPGLHHITAICADARATHEFYTRKLGLRLVKKTVNYDDPFTYHLYFGDGAGSPGTILTFFPWGGAPRGRVGTGQASAIAFAVPEGALDAWMARLAGEAIDFATPGERFGRPVVAFRDPDGIPLELIGVPGEGDAILGFHSATLSVTGYAHTAKLFTEHLGYRQEGEEGERFRFRCGGAPWGQVLDIRCLPGGQYGTMGSGTVHHVAFRAADDAAQVALQGVLAAAGYNVTPVRNRTYFKSIYLREPGGVLVEVATDPPGFTADEPLAELGKSLKLPGWLEKQRELIELALPKL
ncbi:MAG: ring-cleaving dioxygenase [Candidatus Sumerlaeia bacterium]|nr:ring-cleaving dioxygenase [Candidatus Sumerlaeia bacterium]